MKKYLTIIIALIMCSCQQGKTSKEGQPNYIPDGWRIPEQSDIKPHSGWEYYINNYGKSKSGYYVESDFDNDGINDYGWMLINDSKKEYGLFVFVNGEMVFKKIGCYDCDPWEDRQYKMSGEPSEWLVYMGDNPMEFYWGKFEVGQSTCFKWISSKNKFVEQVNPNCN